MCQYLIFLAKVVRSRPRQVHNHFNIKLQHRTKMTSSEEINRYKGKVDERPIRVDHGLMEESEGSSVDGVSHEKYFRTFGGLGMSSNASILCSTKFHHRGGGRYNRILLLVRKQSETFV